MEIAAEPKYEIIIEPTHGWLKIPWRELWEYRDLLALLVRRDFISRYKQTLLGPLWHLLQPVITTGVFVIFTRVAGISTEGIPAPLFILCGLLAWNYFSQNVATGGATFINNSHLFGKVYFPRLIVPIANVVANFIAVALQAIPFFLFLAYFKFCTDDAGIVHFTWRALLIPLPLLHAALLSLGVSLWLSAATAKFRDLVHLNPFLLQIWMFATPVFYPLSKISSAWRWLIVANPMTLPVEAFRYCLLGHGAIRESDIIISSVVTLFVLATGLALFQRVERTVVDSV